METTKKRSPLPWLKPGVFVGSLAPFVAILIRALSGRLGANPIAEALNQLGLVALVFLVASLACTPLKTVFGWTWPLRLRKMLGLLAFFYAGLHVGAYVGLDQALDWRAIADDVRNRRFIFVGFAAFMLLIPLAATSTAAAVRRMGYARWKRLHGLVYPAALLVVTHFLWRVKRDAGEPVIYGLVLGTLLLVRVVSRLLRRVSPRAGVNPPERWPASGPLSRSVLVVLCLVAATASAQEGPPAQLSLPVLIGDALERNPEVQMAQRMVEAKRARIAQVGALPDPLLMYGVVNEGRPVPFQTLGQADFSEVYVGVLQDVPYPGKRGLRAEAAREEVGAEEWAYEGVRRRVAAEVADVYYDLYATHAALEIVEQNRRLLEELVRVASARLSVGQVTQQDVLDAEVEVSRLEERRAQLDRRRAVLEARLRSLLYTDTTEPLARPGPVATRPLTAALEELVARAEKESPFILAKGRLVAQAERKLDLARRDRLPDLGFNFVYHNRGRIDPYYTFGGTVTIPGLHGRQKKAIEEAAADLSGGRSAADAARAEVRYAVTESYRMAATAEHLLRLYDEGILKQARLSLDSAMAQYQVGKVDFLTLVSSWRRLLDYDLTYHEQLADHEKALARLEVHVGALTPHGN